MSMKRSGTLPPSSAQGSNESSKSARSGLPRRESLVTRVSFLRLSDDPAWIELPRWTAGLEIGLTRSTAIHAVLSAHRHRSRVTTAGA